MVAPKVVAPKVVALKVVAPEVVVLKVVAPEGVGQAGKSRVTKSLTPEKGLLTDSKTKQSREIVSRLFAWSDRPSAF